MWTMLRYIDEELIIDRVPAGRDNGDQQVQRQLMGRGRGQGARARAWRVGRQDGPGPPSIAERLEGSHHSQSPRSRKVL